MMKTSLPHTQQSMRRPARRSAALIVPYLFAFLLFGSRAFAQTDDRPIWNVEFSEPKSDYWYGLECADSLHCLMSASNGTGIDNYFLLTSDGGRSWSVRNYDTSSNMGLMPFHTLPVAYPSPDLALVMAEGGYLYRSVDRGETWTLQRVDSTIPTRMLSFFSDPPTLSMCDERHGLIVTWKPSVNKVETHYFNTDDGGVTWNPLPTSPIPPQWVGINEQGAYLRSAHCLRENHYLVVQWTPERLPMIGWTEDGGINWSYVDLPNPSAPFHLEEGTLSNLKFSGVDSTTAFLTGIHNTANMGGIASYIIKTDDGGRSWSLVHHDTVDGEYAGIGDAAFIDEMNGLAIAYGSIIRTTDGGRAWRRDSAEGLIPSTVETGHVAWLTSTRALVALENSLLVWDASTSSVPLHLSTTISDVTIASVTDDRISLSVDGEVDGPLVVRLWDGTGRAVIERMFDGRVVAGSVADFGIPPSLSRGLYFLEIMNGGRRVVLPLTSSGQ